MKDQLKEKAEFNSAPTFEDQLLCNGIRLNTQSGNLCSSVNLLLYFA